MGFFDFLKQANINQGIEEYKKTAGAVLLDVRTPQGKPVYLICQSGLRSYIASRILEGNGYETYNFSGGFRFYDAVVNDRALIERAYACGMDY